MLTEGERKPISMGSLSSVARKGTLFILILSLIYLLLITSKCWLPTQNPVTRSIRIIFPSPKNGRDSNSPSENEKPTLQPLMLATSASPENKFSKDKINNSNSMNRKMKPSVIPNKSSKLDLSNDRILKLLASKNVQVIKLKRYNNSFLVFARDLPKLEALLDEGISETQIERKKGLDPRKFHWRPNEHENVEIVMRYELRSVGEKMYLSVVYERGKVDHIDVGYFWIPAFGEEGKAKAFPRFQIKEDGLLYSPINETRFEWEDDLAEFHECDYKRVKKFYDTHGEKLATDATVETFMRMTVHLRNLTTSWGIYNWICSGSLLGWYRQCGSIPYTTDADTASWAYQYEDWMKDHFLGKDKDLHLWRKYGRPTDSLEFTLRGKGGRIDVFYMYEAVNPPKNNVIPSGKDQRYNWFGVQTFDHYKKGKAIYPVTNRICTADLHGYLVYIPCNAELMVKSEYGKEKWFQPISNYHWITSPNNVIIDGKWTREEWDGGIVYETH